MDKTTGNVNCRETPVICPVKSCFIERESEMGGNVILVVGRGRGDVLDKTTGNVNCRDTAGICGG